MLCICLYPCTSARPHAPAQIALTKDHTLRNEAELERLQGIGANLSSGRDRVVYYIPDDLDDPEDEDNMYV